jgi:hypothetical protein
LNSGFFRLPVLGGLILLVTAAHLSARLGAASLFPETMLGCGILALAAGKAGTKAILAYMRRTESPMLSRVLVVGNRSEAEPYLRLLDGERRFAQVVGFVPAGRIGDAGAEGGNDEGRVAEALKHQAVDEVVLASSAQGLDVQGMATACLEEGSRSGRC